MNYSYVPVNGDEVWCICHVTAGCWTSQTAESNHIIMQVDPYLTLAVNITTPATTVYNGVAVTVTANPNYPVSSYDWYVNGVIVSHGANPYLCAYGR